MRGYGQYFDGFRTPQAAARVLELAAENRDKRQSAEDKNFAENTAKIAAGNGPQVIAGPDSAPTEQDARAIVARVAHAVLQGELNWEAFYLPSNPAFAPLVGLTREQIESAILEALQ